MQKKVIFRREISFRMIGDLKLTPRPDGRWELLVDDVNVKDFNMFVWIQIEGKEFYINFTDLDVVEI
ncbi:MAG: hypothetical protein ACRCVI_03340 [Mycoplasmoidaceae bacterium]